MTDPAVINRDGVGEAVAGPFTVRDITVALSVVLLFLASVLPSEVFRGIVFNVWNSAPLFQLGLSILLPVMVLALFAIRRLAPKTRLRIGSLSVDQFASVVACFNAAYYFLELVSGFDLVSVVGFVGGLGLLAATVCARWIPQFRADFVGRPESAAHPVARDAVEPRPKVAKPKEPAAASGRSVNASATMAAGAGPAANGPAGHTAFSAAAEAARPGAGVSEGAATAQASREPITAAAGTGHGASAGAIRSGSGAATRGTGESLRKSGTAAGTSEAKAPAGPPEDQTAPGAADGEAVGIPISDDEASAAVAAGKAAEAGSAAASATAATESTVPAERGDKTEAHSLAGAGSRGPDAGKGQPDAALSAASGTERTDGPAGARQEETTGATVDSTPKTAAMGTAAAGTNREHGGPISATREHYEEPDEEETAYEAFWFAVGRTRPVFDEGTGQVAFTLEPGAWILALQDRGDEFLVQHTDGRVGVLKDLTNIERA
ncbi:hypothetical protein D477_008878 [Arthrobacter crystallopoietes BAB-32]|uniref:Uncharacterized protein n=1 Tax=Arthrobacter crystallopoietes BAB-32 TaxID=1246476 RepID=N1V3B9_9MICC|nr:hypothetical protein [Arthrobacter crystallopoietes]EMY34514.1 hypothetical protein D477_008878 [Arthrobacter crystallopoietes BAB-32]